MPTSIWVLIPAFYDFFLQNGSTCRNMLLRICVYLIKIKWSLFKEQA